MQRGVSAVPWIKLFNAIDCFLGSYQDVLKYLNDHWEFLPSVAGNKRIEGRKELFMSAFYNP